MHGREAEYIQVLMERHKERDHKEDLDVGGRIILKMDLRRTGWSGMDWIHPAQDRDQWWAFVNKIMNRWFS
jgi:hypothetical protein